MGQIIFKYADRLRLQLTASSVPLSFDAAGRLPVPYPIDLPGGSLVLQAPKGPALLTFANGDTAWSVSVIVPAANNLVLDVPAAGVASMADAATAIDGGTP